MVILQGKSVLQDIGIGRIAFFRRRNNTVKRYLVSDRQEELARFEWAKEVAAAQLKELYEQAYASVGADNAAIFEIHRLMLEDTEYCESVRSMIRTQNVNLEYAVSVTGDNFYKMFHSMEDDYMKARSMDVADITARLLRILSGQQEGELLLAEPSIIAADDLVPSETIQLPAHLVLGFVMRRGSVSSHTAILARSMGIPAIVDVGLGLKEEYDGELAVIDGYTGKLYVRPQEDILIAMRGKKEQSQRYKAGLLDLKGKQNITRDGRTVKVFANAGSLSDVENAIANDAGGIGLFRSELLYMEGASAPGEERQFSLYRSVLERMEGKEVIIRTMDIGADKQVPYLNLEKEENPAMGYRAIRISLSRPELFKTQLRALYRASAYGRLSIMYPMITSVEEVERIRETEKEVKDQLTAQGIPFDRQTLSGIMIETPAAALISDELARRVDFFSVGTNDLTQYTLAVDRSNARLDSFCNTHHKAVLRLISMAVHNAHKAGIWIGICGELAGDMDLTEEFLRMGVDELSVAPGMILPLRQRIRQLDLNGQES